MFSVIRSASAISRFSELREFDFPRVRNRVLSGHIQPVGEFDFRSGSGLRRAEFRKRRAEHRRADGASRRAVQPVVVRALRLQFPLVHPPAAPLGLHPVFGGQVFGEQLMDTGDPSVELKTVTSKRRARPSRTNRGRLSRTGIGESI